IAARTGHRMNALIRLNGLAPPYRLRVGQSLRLPLATGAAPPPAAAPVVAAAPRAVRVRRPRPS
ncbi:MAG: LysM domain-containing protein, partial [Pseudomonadota bacterium]|nr:LysM domain-containing protein [Pseudomonadota bacterium]